ncbi:MAG: hypothetical protein GY925_20105 [Actinomycetia bacterium]|nr:hypothetical protein [Actinomycetes bacterium]
MSGLNDVLGNVYGTAEDKPQKPDLEDVKSSMEALLDDADRSFDAPTPEPVETEAPEAATPIETVPDAALEELDEWIDQEEGDGDPFGTESTYVEDDLEFEFDDTPAVAPDTEIEAVGVPDQPDDDLTDDFFANFEPTDDDDLAESDDPTQESDLGVSWLTDVDGSEQDDDWLNDLVDDDEPTTATNSAATELDDTPELATESFDDPNGYEDDDRLGDLDDTPELAAESFDDPNSFEDDSELADFDFGGSASDTSEAVESGGPLDASPLDASVEDLLDDGDEAWLDDLFAIDGETATDPAPITSAPDSEMIARPALELEIPADEARDVAPENGDTTSSTSAIIHPTPEPNLPPPLDTGGLDLGAQGGGAVDETAMQEPDRAFAPPIHFGGWARIDDDILPSKATKGRRRSKKNQDVAIHIDTSQIDLASATRESHEHAGLQPDAVRTDLSAVADGVPVIGEELSEPTDGDALVHMFSPEEDESKRSKKQKAKAEKKTNKTVSNKSRTSRSKGRAKKKSSKELLDEHDPTADASGLAEAIVAAEPIEEPARSGRKAKAENKAAARAEAKAAKAARAAKKPKKPKGGRGRKAKKTTEEIEAELLAQVEAAAVVAPTTVDEVWADDHVWNNDGLPAPVEPMPLPEGVADPLESALMTPPPPVQG